MDRNDADDGAGDSFIFTVNTAAAHWFVKIFEEHSRFVTGPETGKKQKIILTNCDKSKIRILGLLFCIDFETGLLGVLLAVLEPCVDQVGLELMSLQGTV